VIVFALTVIGALIILQGETALAQSTIFNIPTTDAVAPKKVYFEFDYIGHLEHLDKGGFHSFVPRVVVGAGKGVEVGLNVATTPFDCTHDGLCTAQHQVEVYGNDEKGVAASVGAIAYTPLKDRSANDTFGLFYGNVSKKFKGDYGPRVTVGGYAPRSYDFAGLNKGGAILGYEQPLASRVSFVADWLSGKNALVTLRQASLSRYRGTN
jgi:hypothetical protein